MLKRRYEAVLVVAQFGFQIGQTINSLKVYFYRIIEI
jgi:hypothetical protein